MPQKANPGRCHEDVTACRGAKRLDTRGMTGANSNETSAPSSGVFHLTKDNFFKHYKHKNYGLLKKKKIKQTLFSQEKNKTPILKQEISHA